jgi:hypothetical protein
MAEAKVTAYRKIIEPIFMSHYQPGARDFAFARQEISDTATRLGIKIPSNVGDVVYTFRYRDDLPAAITSRAPEGHDWIILPAGRGRYRFSATTYSLVTPNAGLIETKIPDATPGLISLYALSDEQALLAKLRYNRLIDIFTGIVAYPLQSHLRTTVPDMGQVETDDLYVGVDKRGIHYVLPVQAKADARTRAGRRRTRARDRLSIVQIIQDFGVGATKFPNLICKPIAAQFMADDLIALFAFEMTATGVSLESERHFRLVSPDQFSEDDLVQYRQRLT